MDKFLNKRPMNSDIENVIETKLYKVSPYRKRKM